MAVASAGEASWVVGLSITLKVESFNCTVLTLVEAGSFFLAAAPDFAFFLAWPCLRTHLWMWYRDSPLLCIFCLVRKQ